MDLNTLRNKLQLPYQQENWKYLLKDIFGTQIRFELQSEPIFIDKDQIKSAERFGAISLSDNKNIAIIDITTSNDIKIALNRVGLRELVVRLIDQDVYHGLLVFYHSEDNSQTDYRLSFITQQNVIDEEGKFVKKGTHPKRYSFVLGPNKSCHTPAQRLLGLKKQTFSTLSFDDYSGLTIKDITDAFSVEALTKEFYKELSDWFFYAVQKVQFPDDEIKDEDVRNASYTIRLITRLIFVWFLKQKKLVPDELFDENEIKRILNFSDKTGSTYYKAILQNLFFATLNTEMSCEQRKFINRQYGVQGFYRYERFFKNKEHFLELTHNIPFLNGGLFENLDRNVGQENEMRIDCFSNRVSNETKLVVPDYLFFNGANNANLNISYGDTNHSNVSIRGLIDILKTYNFTVEESSPYEIEVALDPELLGAVFENLLASYNPETKTTARKITGSFYTPREIVNYMVDESIIAYLKNNLLTDSNSYLPFGSNQLNVFGNEGLKQLALHENLNESNWNNQEEELANKLRALISYDSTENEFDENDTEILIKAIDDCKILDPACGSGAFPMGVLHKLVHILSKLDPNNHYWQKIQEERAKNENAEFIARIENDREIANQLAFVDLRNKITKELDSRLEEIKKSFDINANEPDYARKLFLIENCIYGVDIQPIAVQIAKLRFFISLVIDQKIDDDKPNRGILTLPNLETKFVAANTLLYFATNQLKPLSVYPLEAELKEVRHKHFLARTPETKKKYREQDFMLREEIARELKDYGFPPTSADKIAHWDPYDQGKFADFYDSEWMFGLQTGFDIVIGNPPYISIQRMKNEEKLSLKEGKYKSFENTGDIYALFYERGNQLLKPKGILSYITSRQWMQASYGKSLRNFLATETNPLQLIDFGQNRIFEGATVFVNILICQKSKFKNQLEACSVSTEFDVVNENLTDYFDSNKQVIDKLSDSTWAISGSQLINERIEHIGKSIKDWNDIEFFRGVTTGLNEAFHINQETKNQLLQDPNSLEIIKPLLRGKDIKRYGYDYNSLYIIETLPSKDIEISEYPLIERHLLEYKEQLEPKPLNFEGVWNGRKPGRYKWFECQDDTAYWAKFLLPKIVWIEISDRANYAYDDKGMYLTNSAYFLTCKNDNVSLKYLLAVLNSKVADFYFCQKTARIAGGRMRYTKQYVEQIPIPEISLERQKPFVSLVDKILFLKDASKEDSSINKIIYFLEHVADLAVYELYFKEDVYKAGFEIISHIIESESTALDIKAIETLYLKWNDVNHPLRNAVSTLKNYEPFKTIEDKLNRKAE